MSDFNAGRHEAQIEALDHRLCGVEGTVNDIYTKVNAIALSLAEKRGERRAVAYIAAMAAGIVSVIVTLVARAVFK